MFRFDVKEKQTNIFFYIRYVEMFQNLLELFVIFEITDRNFVLFDV